MGAWGIGIFDNDAAGDFVAMVEERGIGLVRETLAFVCDLEDGDYLEADDACFALAAAALVAAARLGRAAGIPAEAADVAESLRADVSAADVTAARQAAMIARERDELPELWAEAERLDEYRAVVDALLALLEEAAR